MTNPPTEAKKRNPAMSWLLKILRILALAYIGVLVMLYFMQRRFIFPGAASQGLSEARVNPVKGTELIALTTAGGEKTFALFGPALGENGQSLPHPEIAPTILFFYGNGMYLNCSDDLFNEFRRLGANVMIPEYVGFGMSDGVAGESGCYAAADAAYAHLLSRGDIDKSRIVIMGWSLGGAVAIDLAARQPPAGLIICSTFTSMAEMGHSQYPFIPTFLASAILAHHFQSESKIHGIKCPIFIGHSHDDNLIPYAMSDRLAAAAGGPVTRLSIDKATHGEFFVGGGAKVRDSLRDFMRQF